MKWSELNNSDLNENKVYLVFKLINFENLMKNVIFYFTVRLFKFMNSSDPNMIKTFAKLKYTDVNVHKKQGISDQHRNTFRHWSFFSRFSRKINNPIRRVLRHVASHSTITTETRHTYYFGCKNRTQDARLAGR
jgi:hypothetical protein